MGFPEDYMHGQEQLLLDLKPHWWRIVPSAAALAGAVLIGIIVVANDWPDALSLLVGVGILAALGWFGISYAQWVSTHFVLTSDRLIYRSGLVSRTGIEIPLERINTVFSSQNLFERVIGAGDLVVESASAEGRQEFDDIRKPQAVQNEIYVAMENNENRKFDRIASSSGGGAPSVSVAEELAKLDDLRTRGVISEAEFAAQKAKLLGS
ncbi:MAG TPA: PH domain-containing protein [Acidimicrobiales bacterium]|nr:PH domain-containing protein [Acidimicrobiales bacterium]